MRFHARRPDLGGLAHHIHHDCLGVHPVSTAPTVYDVAERSGVSIATVSRVYRIPDTVRAETRERVLAAARELGYVPSGNARGLASRSTGVLGLCFPDYSDPDAESEAYQEADDDAAMLYSDQIIRGMERAARRHGYALLIAASLKGGPESLVAKVAGRVDGFAVLARTVPTEDLEVISRRQPVVMLAGPREHVQLDHLDHIEVANADGQRELTRHLIEDHGLRHLAYVGSAEESPDVAARFRGYREACRAAGVAVRDEPDLRVPMMTQAEGARATAALLDRTGDRPEALLFANDQMAVGALHTLERRGCGYRVTWLSPGSTGSPSAAWSTPPSPPCGSRCAGWARRRSNSWSAASTAPRTASRSP